MVVMMLRTAIGRRSGAVAGGPERCAAGSSLRGGKPKGLSDELSDDAPGCGRIAMDTEG